MSSLKKIASVSLLVTAVSLVMAVTAPYLHAAVIGSLREVAGVVDVLHGGALPAVVAKNGDNVATGDLIRTKANGYAEVTYNDGTVLHISPRSRVDIGEHFSGNNPNGSEVRLSRGKVQAIVDLKNAKSSGTGAKKFEVRTPNAIAGVRGTNFFVSHLGSATSVYVRTGSVYSFNPSLPGRIVTLAPGTITNVYGRSAPTPPQTAQQRDIQRMEQDIRPPASGNGGQQGNGGTNGNGGTSGSVSTTVSVGTTVSGGTSGSGGTPDSGGTLGSSGTLMDLPPPTPPLPPTPVMPPVTVKTPIITPPPTVVQQVDAAPQKTNVNVNVNIKFK